MPPVHRMGDANDAGGVITRIPQTTVEVEDRLVAVDGSMGTSHSPFVPQHLEGQWVTTNGSSTVEIEGIPVNRQGDPDSCGHVRAAGSPTVEIG